MDWRTKVELFEAIRKEHEFGEGTIAGVARKPGIHRRMVREALEKAVPLIEVMLAADMRAPRKQRHTAHSIRQRLNHEPAAFRI